MSARMTSVRRVAELLPALNAAFPTDLLPVVRNFLASTAGAKTADILMADYDLLVLRRLPPDMTAGIVESLSVDDSAAGRAFINQDPITVVEDAEVHVYVPISLRAERLGVLDVTLTEAPGCARAGHLRPAGDRAGLPAPGGAQLHRHRGAGAAGKATGAAGRDAVVDAADPGLQLWAVQPGRPAGAGVRGGR
jgi:hypothetical protein